MRIHCLQHVPYESPGSILQWAAAGGHSIQYTRYYEKDPQTPALDSFDLLLVMGGYMNVDELEKFPWLAGERAFIRQAIDGGKKILGICLGSQLLAAALGSRVYPAAEKEIGFFSLRFSSDARESELFSHFSTQYPAFHWHGDTFDCPQGATLIASTGTCPNQAFLLGKNLLGLQFHLEMDEATLEAMLEQDGEELITPGIFIQSPEQIRADYPLLEKNRADLFLLLDQFILL